jgi:hypothetical protein
MFISWRRQADLVELDNEFTPEETVRITHLQGQYRTAPVCYRFDINYRRLEFARWLVDHGYLDEWRGTPPGEVAATWTRRTSERDLCSA